MKVLTKIKNRISKMSIADIIGKFFIGIGMFTFLLYILMLILAPIIFLIDTPSEDDYLDHDTCQCD